MGQVAPSHGDIIDSPSSIASMQMFRETDDALHGSEKNVLLQHLAGCRRRILQSYKTGGLSQI